MLKIVIRMITYEILSVVENDFCSFIHRSTI